MYGEIHVNNSSHSSKYIMWLYDNEKKGELYRKYFDDNIESLKDITNILWREPREEDDVPSNVLLVGISLEAWFRQRAAKIYKQANTLYDSLTSPSNYQYQLMVEIQEEFKDLHQPAGAPIYHYDTLKRIDHKYTLLEESIPSLLTKADMARRWNVTRQVVNNWEERHKDKGFPPVAVTVDDGQRPLYLESDVEKYEKIRNIIPNKKTL